jgi:hypothetical protein
MREIDNKRDVLHKMRKKYFPKDKPYVDWMGFKITETNCPSYHHIEKAEDLRNDNESDRATLENGAYLGKKSHELLHVLERIDGDLYTSWNYLFSLINRMGVYPIEDVWKMIYSLQEMSIKAVNDKKSNTFGR